MRAYYNKKGGIHLEWNNKQAHMSVMVSCPKPLATQCRKRLFKNVKKQAVVSCTLSRRSKITEGLITIRNVFFVLFCFFNVKRQQTMWVKGIIWLLVMIKRLPYYSPTAHCLFLGIFNYCLFLWVCEWQLVWILAAWILQWAEPVEIGSPGFHGCLYGSLSNYCAVWWNVSQLKRNPL